MKTPLRPIWFALLVVGLMAVTVPATATERPRQILVLPFNIFAPQAYDYLKQGIAANLNSRLQGPGIAPIVPTQAMLDAAATPDAVLSQEAIQTIAASLGAAFAIEGHVTIVGDAVSTAIQLWEMPGGALRINFHAQGERPEAVLAHVDQFIRRLETEVGGVALPATQSPEIGTQPAKQPDAAPALSWQSPRLPYAARGMALADLSPAPGQEIAVINDQDLMIYTRRGEEVTPLATVKGQPYLRLVAVDAADINANGQAEIFVSAFHTRLGKPRSFVVEWQSDHGRFTKTFENLPTYFRVMEMPPEGSRLIGQPGGLSGFFGAQPAAFEWEKGYTAGQPLDLPDKAHIYAFALGDFIPGENSKTTITLTRRKKMMIYRGPDDSPWISEDTYGGSAVYLDDSQTPQNQTKQLKQVGEETLKRLYLHPRMLVADVDNDGNQELLIVRNTDATGGLFRRSRLLTSGRIVCLRWQDLGPVVKWETPPVSGHITDMALNPAPESGRYELSYMVVDRKAKQLAPQQSYLVSHQLGAAD